MKIKVYDTMGNYVNTIKVPNEKAIKGAIRGYERMCRINIGRYEKVEEQ